MILEGKPVSLGIARGAAFVMDGRLLLQAARSVKPQFAPDGEVERLTSARSRAVAQLAIVKRQLDALGRSDAATIFAAHAALLDDISLIGRMEVAIRGEARSAEAAVADMVFGIEEQFHASGNSMLQDKVTDFIDIGQRLVRCLRDSDEIASVDGRVVVADSLTPSELVRVTHHGAVAVVTEHCGPRSHTAILARGFALPFVTGITDASRIMPVGADLLVDAETGRVVIDPDAADLEVMIRQMAGTLSTDAGEPASSPITIDGTQISVLLNISGIPEAEAVSQLGADGVGLYRTEFLYMDRLSWPTEDESRRIYESVAAAVGDQELNIRLADFGAEKCPAYADIAVNRNPSLGIRGVRLLMSRDDIFRPQVRALTRLAEQRPITVLLPMIDTLDMLHAVVKRLCRHAGCRNRENLPFRLSSMIEVPSAALMIDELIEHVDAVSIGLNDLTQYLLAADRDDELVESYHDSLQPAVLRLVHRVILTADNRGKSVTMCGELAGDPVLARLLLGLGARRFSVSQSHYRRTVNLFRELDLSEQQRIAGEAVKLDSRATIHRLMTRSCD